MARSSSKTPAAAKPAEAPPSAKAPAPAAPEIPVADLARAIIAREVRPGVAQVRRLAEAIFAAENKRAKKKSKGEGKKDGGKKRKLAKIPGQKPKK
jgi:hypothetical protein